MELEYNSLDDRVVQVKLWDISSKEEQNSLAMISIRQSDSVLIAFDVSSEKSFNGVRDWNSKVMRARGLVPITVVGVIPPEDSGRKRVVEEKQPRELANFYQQSYFEVNEGNQTDLNNMFGEHLIKTYNSKKEDFDAIVGGNVTSSFKLVASMHTVEFRDSTQKRQKCKC